MASTAWHPPFAVFGASETRERASVPEWFKLGPWLALPHENLLRSGGLECLCEQGKPAAESKNKRGALASGKPEFKETIFA
jgi:hypothetical protein